MLNRTNILSFVCAITACLASACHSDGLYDPCPMSNSILDACAQVVGEGTTCQSDAECLDGLTCVGGTCADGTAYTCVVAEHPFCLEEICASWQGGEAVCTRACVSDDECPGEGRCMAHNDLKFCVDSSQLVDWSPFEQPGPLEDGESCGGERPCQSGSECCPDGSAQALRCAPVGSCDE